MPRKKLTLSVDETVIRKAKRYAKRHATSVSQLVNRFLSQLDDGDRSDAPIVSRLRGILPPGTGRDAYRRQLERKHLE